MLRCFTWTPEPKLRALCLHGKYSTTPRFPQLLLEDREKWLKFICVWWGAHMSWHPWEGERTRVPWNSHGGSRFSLTWALGLGRGSSGLVANSFTFFAISSAHGGLLPKQQKNNVHKSLHSRLTNRSILAFLPLSPCRHCKFRQSTQEMPAHYTPPIQTSLSCAWWPGPLVSGAGSSLQLS